MKQILHIIPNEKFTFLYVKKIDELISEYNHRYIIYGSPDNDKIDIPKGSNLIFWKITHLGRLAKYVKNSSKIIMHSLNMPNEIWGYILLIQPLIKSKLFWNIWGGDLYNVYWHRNSSFKAKVRELLRKRFIGLLCAVGYIPSDYTFLEEHYKTDAKFFLASYYYNFFEINKKNNNNSSMVILLGNSATETSQYEDIIDKLTKVGAANIKVYCILSYPDNTDYVKKIINYGKAKLGDDAFIPLTNYLKYDEYIEFLASVDIAIFNHNRQQALGNIASLLYLGKKVIINPLNGCKDYFERIGATVFSSDNLEQELFIPLSESDKHSNKECIKSFFSDEKFSERWRKIFDSSYL